MSKSLHTAAMRGFLEKLQRARVDRDITQIELALRIGRTQSFVSKVERGERRLDVLEFCEWANALGILPSKFLAEIVTE